MRGWRRWYAALLVCLTLNAASVWPALAAPAHDLVGLVLGGREVATLLVIERNGRLWLPLDEFASYTALNVVAKGGREKPLKLRTPIGDTSIPRDRTLIDAGIVYVDEAYFSQTLNFRLKRDREARTLAVSVPWRGRSNPSGAEEAPAANLEPEATPTAYGLTSIHGRVNYEPTDIDTRGFTSTVRMTGYAFDGVWQLAYDEVYGNRIVRDALWMRQLGDHHIIQLGHQTLALHALMPHQELTGVQWAWSSRAIRSEAPRLYPGVLLDRWNTSRRTFAGKGPVGGRAELWINGHLAAQRDIGLDGDYRFSDVPLYGSNAQVEIRIYDGHNPRTPVRVESRTLELSDLLLNDGETTIVAAAGYAGNVVRPLFDDGVASDKDKGVAGIALVRWGAHERLTLEGGVRLTEEQQTVLGGIVARVLPGTFVTASVAVGDRGQVGHDISVTVTKDRWRFYANSFRGLVAATTVCAAGTGTTGCASRRQVDHARLSFLPARGLEMGLMARRDEDVAFVLPFVYWHYSNAFSARLRPTNAGDYRFDATWWLTRSDTLQASATPNAASLNWQKRLYGSELTLTVGAGYDFTDEEVEGLIGLSGRQLASYAVDWRVAAIARQSGFGFEGSLRRELHPGVYGVVEASMKPQRTYEYPWETSDSDRDDTRVRIGLSFDLGLTPGGRLVAAGPTGVRPDTGTIAGVVAPNAGSVDLSGIPVLVDGKIAGRTRADGSFFIDGVPQGKRLVELDEEKLPLEHVATKRSVVAKVAPGAVTSITFPTKVLFGAAGKVTRPSGDPLPNVDVIVLDAAGTVRGRAQTDQFGFFRIDNLEPGSFNVRVTDAAGKVRASRPFQVRDDFVFGLDLSVTQ